MRKALSDCRSHRNRVFEINVFFGRHFAEGQGVYDISTGSR